MPALLPSGSFATSEADTQYDIPACHLSVEVSQAMASPVARRKAIVALSNTGFARNSIARLVGYSVSSVRCWIARGKASETMHDQARSGRPALYSQEIKLRVVAFYCQTQPLPNCGRWSFRWAECSLKVDTTLVGAAPSKSTLHRILQSNQLKPHQSRYFLQITDPDFFVKMEHLIDLYRNPPPNLFFFDECPGIQILKRLTPDVQTDGMRKRLEEFEYIRNGTMDVLAFLSHADSNVYIECCADHKTTTFVEVFSRHANQYPQSETLHYVMDNLATHRGYPFCERVAKLSKVECPSKQELRTLDKRVKWLGRKDKRIIIHFTPYHGSWLNWVEFWFGIMGRKVLGESFSSADELKMALEAFVDIWNTQLAHPFQWSYKGEGLQEKAVNRFTKMLHGSVEKMELRTLSKQLMLMTNLIRDYVSEVPTHGWDQFLSIFHSQSEPIIKLIESEEKPKSKNKARQALENLNEALRKCFEVATQEVSADRT